MSLSPIIWKCHGSGVDRPDRTGECFFRAFSGLHFFFPSPMNGPIREFVDKVKLCPWLLLIASGKHWNIPMFNRRCIDSFRVQEFQPSYVSLPGTLNFAMFLRISASPSVVREESQGVDPQIWWIHLLPLIGITHDQHFLISFWSNRSH